MDLRGIIDDYISREVHGNTEKEKVSKLLLDDLKKYLEEEQLPYEIDIKTLQINEAYCENLGDAFLVLLQKTTNSKEITQKRIISFSEYLLKNYKVDLHLNEAFEREAMNPYERLVDLLKVLQDGKTRQELMDYYSISRKPLGDDIDKLINETMIFGQRVKIRDIQSEKRKITYQSTVHPVFLPLNMTEIYYLIMGLKSLSREADSIASKTYDHLANRVYCQLSDYARNKIDKKGNEMGIEFPREEDFNLYNGSRDEEKMSNEDIESTLMYLYKAGVMCNIQLNGDETSYVDCYIDYDINANKVYLKHSLHGERIIKLDFEQICNLQYVYE